VKYLKIYEVFDLKDIYDYNFFKYHDNKKRNSKSYIYKFKSLENVYFVDIEITNHGVVMLDFKTSADFESKKEGKLEETNEHDQYKVIGTVSRIFEEFIKKYKYKISWLYLATYNEKKMEIYKYIIYKFHKDWIEDRGGFDEKDKFYYVWYWFGERKNWIQRKYIDWKNNENKDFDFDFDFDEEEFEGFSGVRLIDKLELLDDGTYYMKLPITDDNGYYENLYDGMGGYYDHLMSYMSIRNTNIKGRLNKGNLSFYLLIDKGKDKYIFGWEEENSIDYVERNWKNQLINENNEY